MPSDKKDTTTLSEINVTPLVDVFLVLMIIFMVTAPMLQQGVDVQLPRESAINIEAQERDIVTITKDKRIYLNNRRITLSDLSEKLKQKAVLDKGKEVFLRADKNVPYGFVVKVMANIKRAGIEKLGMVTEPAEG
ncbi:MAG TPA: ExbD/TolR family protein [Nitrospinota bacterium]|nr:ExbD/TolR family protein [Nitrospinota bacterium]